MEQELVNVRRKRHPFSTYIAAPSVRKAAREQYINLENVQGSGRNKRILHADLNDDQSTTKTLEKVIPLKRKMAAGEQRIYKEIPYTGIRKKLAENLVHSVQTIPHVTHYDDMDLTHLLELRKTLKASGESISVVVFFLKALAVALKEFPVFNGRLNEKDEQIELSRYVNIGLATDTPDGLSVPVLKYVEKKSLVEIQTEMKALTREAQQGKLKTTDRRDSTFTISNVGPIGGIWATPIIHHSQTGIMAFHKIKRVPVDYRDGHYDIKSMMNVSFSFDHRIADGADSIQFTNRFIELLEHPERLIAHLSLQ